MGTTSASIPKSRPNSEVVAENGKIDVSLLEPCGLLNLGNTCYMNSVIQLLHSSPIFMKYICELGDGIQTASSDSSKTLIQSLIRLFKEMRSSEKLTPIEFLMNLRKSNSQFSEIGEGGMFSQQDAEECAQTILAAARQHGGQNTNPFEGELRISLEKKDEVLESTEKFTELTCHISQETLDLVQGIRESFSEIISTSDPSVSISKNVKLLCCPDILIVRFLRFFWKQKEQVKAKIMKKVKFPLELDISSLAADSSSCPKYHLRAVLTHCGRSADSGHYICWIKDVRTSTWWKMDDDKVTAVKEDDIKKLDGGGDWHMAYLCLYEAEQK